MAILSHVFSGGLWKPVLQRWVRNGGVWKPVLQTQVMSGGGWDGRTFTISVSANPSAGGNVTGGGTYAFGASAFLTAAANSPYEFTGWYEGGSFITGSTTYEFVVESNRTLEARFVNNTLQAPNSISPSDCSSCLPPESGSFFDPFTPVYTACGTVSVANSSFFTNIYRYDTSQGILTLVTQLGPGETSWVDSGVPQFANCYEYWATHVSGGIESGECAHQTVCLHAPPPCGDV